MRTDTGVLLPAWGQDPHAGVWGEEERDKGTEVPDGVGWYLFSLRVLIWGTQMTV